VVSLLLRHGASVEKSRFGGLSAIDAASGKGHDFVAAILASVC
jgi:hypothetical protein